MIPVFIGYDRVESVAYHVLSHSILSRSSSPVAITPINQKNLSGRYYRPRGEYDSNEFSNTRWLVPNLMGYSGWAIWMDCDMLMYADIAELWNQRDDNYAVMVKQHDHRPKEDIKFLGQKQTKYGRKNWSSLVMFNCHKCKPLTLKAVNTKPGLWLHQFQWLPDEEIGAIKGDWNLLINYDEPVPNPKHVHWTAGGPWHNYKDDPYALDWEREYEDMIKGDNPIEWWSDETQTSISGR